MRKKKAEIENLTKTEEETPVEEEVISADPSPYMNEAEQSALAEQHEKDIEDLNKVSTSMMETAVEVVSNLFNLNSKGFSVTGFADKGSKIQLSMTNGDFDITVVVKDAEKFGIV